ncbi:MAG TPA: hypothetical protein VGN00_20575 [Puia sp.]
MPEMPTLMLTPGTLRQGILTPEEMLTPVAKRALKEMDAMDEQAKMRWP